MIDLGQPFSLLLLSGDLHIMKLQVHFGAEHFSHIADFPERRCLSLHIIVAYHYAK